MKISLITATYNSYPQIQDTINCIQQQAYPNIEWIVIDGGSTDLTKWAIENSNVTNLWLSEPDNGIYDALNKGLKLAKGDIIGFLHSDDLLASPTILEDITTIFQKTQADGVFGDLQYVSREDTNKIIRNWKSKPFHPGNLKYGWMPAHPTLFLKREIYEKHGFFDLSYKIAADYDFMLRILKDPELNFEYLPKVISKMRVGGASNKSVGNIVQKSKEDLQAIYKNKVGGFYTLILKNIRKIGQFL